MSRPEQVFAILETANPHPRDLEIIHDDDSFDRVLARAGAPVADLASSLPRRQWTGPLISAAAASLVIVVFLAALVWMGSPDADQPPVVTSPAVTTDGFEPTGSGSELIWTRLGDTTLADAGWADLLFFEGSFYLVGPTNRSSVLRSPDGEQWDVVDVPFDPVAIGVGEGRMAFGGIRFGQTNASIAGSNRVCPEGEAVLLIASTTDGARWETSEISISELTASDTSCFVADLGPVAAGPAGVMASVAVHGIGVDDRTVAWHSSDGVAWTQAARGGPMEARRLDYGVAVDDGFVVFAEGRAFKTVDGSEWELIDESVGDQELFGWRGLAISHSAAPSHDLYNVENGDVLGLSEALQDALAEEGRLEVVVFGPGGVFAHNASPWSWQLDGPLAMLWSVDGEQWQAWQPSNMSIDGAAIDGVGVGNDRVLIVVDADGERVGWVGFPDDGPTR